MPQKRTALLTTGQFLSNSLESDGIPVSQILDRFIETASGIGNSTCSIVEKTVVLDPHADYAGMAGVCLEHGFQVVPATEERTFLVLETMDLVFNSPGKIDEICFAEEEVNLAPLLAKMGMHVLTSVYCPKKAMEEHAVSKVEPEIGPESEVEDNVPCEPNHPIETPFISVEPTVAVEETDSLNSRIPASQAVEMLELGGPASYSDESNASDEANYGFRSGLDFSDVHEHASLLAEQCRWSIERKTESGYSQSGRVRDEELEMRAKKLGVYLWQLHYQPDDKIMIQLSCCYELVAKAYQLLDEAIEHKEKLYSIQVFRDIAQVAADAQCALKTGLQNAGIPLSRAFFQRNIFYLLRQVTQDHGCMLERMRKESEMPLDQLPEIEQRYNLLAAELKNIKTFVKQRKELFGKIDYHLRKIETHLSQESRLAGWQKVVSAVTLLCREHQVPPSSLEFREPLLDRIDEIPDDLEITDEFGRVVQEIQTYCESLKQPQETEERSTPLSPEISAVRQRFAGKEMVFVGGVCQLHLKERIEDAFQIKLHWPDAKHGQSLDRFKTFLNNPNVELFLVQIPWASHQHTQELCTLVEEYGKTFVRLPGSTNPNQIALKIIEQLKLGQ